MATIAQPSLFSWDEIETTSDLDRLSLVLSVLPDEKLMSKLEQKRGKGRNDYPVRAMWNSCLAGIVFQHPSVASLRREMQRNAELRQCCGYDPCLGMDAVPTARAFTSFLGQLIQEEKTIQEIFNQLIQQLCEHLPDLGTNLAIDGKAIPSAGKPNKKTPDGRRDTDADWGVKTYRGKKPDGSAWNKVKSWFGYNLHLLIDADYELPLGYEVTKASVNDTTKLLPLMEALKDTHPQIIEQAQTLCADRGYDSTKNNQKLYDRYQIKPIIDIRHCWKDGDKTRPLYPDQADFIVYDEDGTPCCHGGTNPEEQELIPLAFDGFEAKRGTLKYRCPAAAYDFYCPSQSQCGNQPQSNYGRIIRIPLSLDRRLFVPTPRHSYKFKNQYKKRVAVERVNSRLDVSFGFERHFIRGQQKMQVQVGLALIVMLAMALGRIQQGQSKQMRSLIKPILARAA